jgi:hypothetical protein
MQTVLVICISMRDTQGNGCFFHFVCLIVIATLQLTINQCSATILCCRCLLVYSFLLVGVWQFTQYLQGRSPHALFTYSAVVWTCDEVGWPFVLNDNDVPLIFHNRFSFSQLVHVFASHVHPVSSDGTEAGQSQCIHSDLDSWVMLSFGN